MIKIEIGLPSLPISVLFDVQDNLDRSERKANSCSFFTLRVIFEIKGTGIPIE